jgi:ABC-type multidrug transport system fused ATPase/permease subunit
VFGLITVSVFETLLAALRTYVFAHTTNRIDVELGARLYRHLIALPLAYFEARRVGDSVARVRELENIRNFLTSSALTLVIDLLFYRRIPGRNVLLRAVVDLDRDRLLPALYRDFGWSDAGLSSAAR